LAIVFAGIAFTLFKIFWGEPLRDCAGEGFPKLSATNETAFELYSKKQGSCEPIQKGETNIPGVAMLLLLLVVIMVTGMYMPSTLKELITNAQQIITGG